MRPGPRSPSTCDGLDEVRAARARVHARGGGAGACGIEADEIRRIARELAAAERGAVYGAHRHVHAGVRHARELARRRAQRRSPGNLDREGGAMFTRAAAGQRTPRAPAAAARASRFGRWAEPRARPARGRSASCRWRASPRRSTRRARARSARSSRSPATRSSRRRTRSGSTRALEGLDFMVAVDIYLNETTRHADVILPGPEPLEQSHYDLALYQLAVRNVANYSPRRARARPVPRRVARRCCGSPAIVAGQGPDADVDALDAIVIDTLVAARAGRPGVARRRPRRRRAARGARAAPRAGAHPRPHAARRALRRRLRRRPGRPDARRARAEPARHRPRRRSSRGSRRCCARRRARSSSRPSRSSPTSPRLRGRARARAERRAWC